jgi:hypothetical protein
MSAKLPLYAHSDDTPQSLLPRPYPGILQDKSKGNCRGQVREVRVPFFPGLSPRGTITLYAEYLG